MRGSVVSSVVSTATTTEVIHLLETLNGETERQAKPVTQPMTPAALASTIDTLKNQDFADVTTLIEALSTAQQDTLTALSHRTEHWTDEEKFKLFSAVLAHALHAQSFEDSCVQPLIQLCSERIAQKDWVALFALQYAQQTLPNLKLTENRLATYCAALTTLAPRMSIVQRREFMQLIDMPQDQYAPLSHTQICMADLRLQDTFLGAGFAPDHIAVAVGEMVGALSSPIPIETELAEALRLRDALKVSGFAAKIDHFSAAALVEALAVQHETGAPIFRSILQARSTDGDVPQVYVQTMKAYQGLIKTLAPKLSAKQAEQLLQFLRSSHKNPYMKHVDSGFYKQLKRAEPDSLNGQLYAAMNKTKAILKEQMLVQTAP